MTDNELINEWYNLQKFNEGDFKEFTCNSETINLLTETGLPEEAGPYLTFGTLEKPTTIYETFETYNLHHQQLIEIGTDGYGDPICIDAANECIVVACDHENDFETRFVNSSVKHLLQFLTIYKRFIDQLINEKGADAFIDSKLSDDEFNMLKNTMLEVDNKALQTNSFWYIELEMLKANKEDSAN